MGVISLIFLAGGTSAWEYTNSPAFCGTACHTMPPEYTAYLSSPHARVDCVECHIGRDYIATRISRKAGDASHLFASTFQTYEFPIRSKNMRPARETCELCHYPEKFSNDSLVEIKKFAPDLENTPSSIFLVMKIGGGSEREGLGRGIHWHIENQVLYYPLDSLEQEIPYVRVASADGTIVEYVDVESGFDPSIINSSELKEMDCITCHNRVTHMIFTPEDTVNQLLDRGLISQSIPEIRKKAVEVYSQIYSSTEMGIAGIGGLAGYYEVYHPDFYKARGEELHTAIEVLQDAYRKSVFTEQKADWTSHFNNVGHKDSPGCFRCHGGKHLDDEQQAIRLECNLCHTIPVVASQSDFLVNIEISRGPEPQSHLDANWISLHHLTIDATCANCHTTENPGGTDNTSFCSNSACHHSVWDYAGFDAPALREILISQLPPTPTPAPVVSPAPGASVDEKITYDPVVGAILDVRCASCHSSSGGPKGLDFSSYETLMAGGPDGPVVVPGDPDSSLLVGYTTGTKSHFSSFSSQELEVVRSWIESGAPER
jgi:hypothetical protein